MRKINLKKFAELADVIAKGGDAIKDGEQFSGTFNNIKEMLGGLGYDVLINHRESEEFVPSGRLSQVVSQREQFKTQAETLDKALKEMKLSAGDNEALKAQLDQLISENGNNLTQLSQQKVDFEILAEARDAVNPKDLLLFIDRNNVEVNKKGEVVGVKAELDRLRKEKPYLFTGTGDHGGRGGRDSGDGGKGDGKISMNSMIRAAAGRL